MKIRRPLAAGLLVIPLAFLTAGCVGVKNPEGWASPAIDGSSAYIFEKKDRLTNLNLQDNGAAVRWSFPDDDKRDQKEIDLEAVYGQPVVDGELVYVAGYSGELLAIERETADLRRRREFKGNIPTGLVLDNGQLAFGTTEGRVVLVEADGFNTVEGWPDGGVDFKGGIWATPALSDDRVFAATMDGEVVALDRANGRVAWRFETAGAVPSLALLDDTHLFVGTLGKEVFVLDPATGDVKVEFKTSDWVWNTPAFKDSIAYFGDFSGNVYALDITSGQQKWRYSGGSKVKSGPVIIDDVLVLADRKPVVHFIDLDGGTRLNQVPLLDVGTIRADLVVNDGKAMIVTTKGRLYAADPKIAPGAVNEIDYGAGR